MARAATAQIIGRIGSTPKLAHTSGTHSRSRAVLNLRVAVAHKRDKNNANWYSVTAWEGLAETLAVTLEIGQGDLVYVAGDLGIDHYTDRAGVACSAPVITARDVQLLARARRDEPRDTHATRRTRTDPRRTQPPPEQRHQSITDAPPRSYRQP